MSCLESSISFSQKDIIKGSLTDALSLNRYLYCQNDPVNFIDPSGMTLKSAISKAVNNVTAKVSNTYNSVKTTVTNTYNTVKTAATNTYNTVKTGVTNTYNTVKTAVTNTYNTIRTGVVNTYNEVKTDVVNAYNSAKSTVENWFTPKVDTTQPGNDGQTGTGPKKAQPIYNHSEDSDGGGGGTHTETPGYYDFSQPGSLKEFFREKTNCGKTGNIFSININKLDKKTVQKAEMIGTSALEIVGGIVIAGAVAAGTIAGGWLILAGTVIGAGVGSLIGAELTDYDMKAWLLGMAEGGSIGALATLFGAGGAMAGGSAALVGGGASTTAAEIIAEAGLVVEKVGEVAIGGTVVYAAKEAGESADDYVSESDKQSTVNEDKAGNYRQLSKNEIKQIGGENTTAKLKKEYGGSYSDLRIDSNNNVYVVRKGNLNGEYIGTLEDLIMEYGGY